MPELSQRASENAIKALPQCGPSDARGEELSVFCAGFSCKHGAQFDTSTFSFEEIDSYSFLMFTVGALRIENQSSLYILKL